MANTQTRRPKPATDPHPSEYRVVQGAWVHERLLDMPSARALSGLPMATVKSVPTEALSGYTFEGYVNADGSVGTRNLLAITTTVQCVAGVLKIAVERIERFGQEVIAKATS